MARDLGDLGLLNAKRTLFRRCNLLFVDPAPIQQKALQEQLQQEEEVQQQVQRQRHELQQAPGPRKLLAGVQEAVDASLSWQQRARDNEMKELALQVGLPIDMPTWCLYIYIYMYVLFLKYMSTCSL